MAKVTRRRFLQQASFGAAAASMIAVVPRLTGSHSRGPVTATHTMTPARPLMASAVASTGTATQPSSEPVVAYVRDRSKGEVAIYVGMREVVYHDPELVARLVRATA